MQLYNKYRPQTFDEVYGNSTVTRSLKSMVESKKVPHTILFQGPYGCGKTTLGRILANELGCSDFDLVEIDIGNFTGVDSSREISKTARLRPVKGDVRVYIFDEIQNSTKNAQEALLKLTEEPPPHAYFFLCTTDPQKLLGPLKSRCVSFTVRPLPEKAMFRFLKFITKKEKKTIPNEVLYQIAHDSLGHPRNALNILEKIIYIEDREDLLEVAKEEAQKQEHAIELCRALAKDSDWKDVANILSNLDDDPERTRRAILTYFSKVLLNSRKDKDKAKAFLVLESFENNFFESDRAGLIKACFEVIEGGS